MPRALHRQLEYLLNVECDQKFVVQDKTAPASEQAVRDSQKLCLPMELSFVPRIESGSIKNDIPGENSCL
jgi:hypothetical protein